jgi:hypothetical protein
MAYADGRSAYAIMAVWLMFACRVCHAPDAKANFRPLHFDLLVTASAPPMVAHEAGAGIEDLGDPGLVMLTKQALLLGKVADVTPKTLSKILLRQCTIA